MTPLELRAIAYAVVAFVLIGVGTSLGMHHVQAQWNIDKLAQAKVIEKAQADLAASLIERDKLTNQVQETHAQLIQNGAALTGSLNDSVRNVAEALRTYTLRASMGDTGKPNGTGASTGSGADIDAAVKRVEDAISALSGACVHDSAELTSILALQPKN